MTYRRTHLAWMAVVAALAVGASAPAWASEPVKSQYILGELIPINEDAEYKVRSIDLNIGFGYDSAELTEDAKIQVRELGSALMSSRLDGATFGIYGHTDAKGAADYNLNLSEKRAQAVLEYLLAEFDIDPARLTAKGLGETQLKNAETPNAPENRRVQVVTLTPPTPKAPEPKADTGGFVTGNGAKTMESPSQPMPAAMPGAMPEAPAMPQAPQKPELPEAPSGAGGAIKF